jgi:TolB protein
VYYAYQDKLYFISDRDTTHRMYFLYEMDAEGNNVRKVTDLRLEDSWMSSRNDGKEMVVAGRIGKEIRYQLFMIDIPSGVYKQLTTDTTAQFADPCFSPDGSQIVFRHRTNRRNFQTEKAELWIMNSDGTSKRQLTHYPESDTTAKWHSYHAGPPMWFEPNIISYTSMQQGNYSIFSISPDGNGLNQLTGNVMNEGWHSWSPAGQYMAFDGTDPVNSNYDIYLMTRDGKVITKLVSDWRAEQGPVFVKP